MNVGVNVASDAGFNVDRMVWSDSRCVNREARLARASASQNGGYLYDMTWNTGAGVRVGRGTCAGGLWCGWGYVVLHYGANGSSAAVTQSQAPNSVTVPLAGRHHAIHRQTWRLSPGGNVDVTVHWLFMTGRDEPLYAITIDSTPAGPNGVRADTRAPYGDFTFEGTAGEIGGIGWGDTHQFATTCGNGPASFNCSWTYNQTNTIPFVRMWSRPVDAEMGAVQTTTYVDHPAGGDYGGGLLASVCRNRTSTTQLADCRVPGATMPQSWMWPYQLNQYELDSSTTSHRLAWGMTYGSVGQRMYDHFGQMLVGYPYQSYTVWMALGARQSTLRRVDEVERLTKARLTASVGSALTQAPGGIGRTDLVTLATPGYVPTYAAFEARAQAGAATVTLDPRGGPIRLPLFRFHDRPAAPTSILLNGVPARPDIDVFVTQDGTITWLTVNGTVNAPLTVSVQ